MKITEILTEKQILDRKTLTVDQVALKHNVSKDYVLKQLKLGISVELEHTTDRSIAKEIALDHLAEKPDYYQRLKKVESY